MGSRYASSLGLEMADQIVAVSQGYAREIRTPEYDVGCMIFSIRSQKNFRNHQCLITIYGIQRRFQYRSNLTTQSLKRREENRHSILHA
jgi:glycogen synthase